LNYDIHIYLRNSDEREEALELQKVLIENNVQTFPFVEKPIGPHPYPMFESHVSSQTLSVIESLLVANRKSCSILIHEKTGDHVYDHTKGARFLGESLELNIEFLRNF
jgi:DOPA 4,5-dioxygenase